MDGILQAINGALSNPVTQKAGTQTVDIIGQGPISPINTIGQLVQTGAAAILTIGSLALLMYLLLGGFNWITAGGDKSKVEAARSMITQGIIGIAILASVFAIYGVILRFFGIKSIQIGAGNATSTTQSSTSGGSSSCPAGQVNDGGSGGYCNGGAACIVMVDAGKGPSKLNYAHYEPVSCVSGSKNSAYTFYNP